MKVFTIVIVAFKVTNNGVPTKKLPNIHPRTQIVAQVVQQPDVEVWASSDEDSDMQWPDIDENSSHTQETFDGNDSDLAHKTPTQPSQLGLSFEEKDTSRLKSRSADSSPHRNPSSRFHNDSINEFEIKVPAQTSTTSKEMDFFADMEPEITTSCRLKNPTPNKSPALLNHSSTNGFDLEDVKTPLTVNSAFRAPDSDDEVSIVEFLNNVKYHYVY